MSDRYSRLFRLINLEKGLILGGIMLVLGLILSFYSLNIWKESEFGNLQPTEVFRLIIPSVFTILIGIQIILFSFFFSILGLKRDGKS